MLRDDDTNTCDIYDLLMCVKLRLSNKLLKSKV